jgi:hypothetical protein
LLRVFSEARDESSRIDLAYQLALAAARARMKLLTASRIFGDAKRSSPEESSDYELRQSTWASYAALLASNEFLFVD